MKILMILLLILLFKQVQYLSTSSFMIFKFHLLNLKIGWKTIVICSQAKNASLHQIVNKYFNTCCRNKIYMEISNSTETLPLKWKIYDRKIYMSMAFLLWTIRVIF